MRKVRLNGRNRMIAMIIAVLLAVAIVSMAFVTNINSASAATDGDAYIGETYKLRSESVEDSMQKANKFNESIAEEGMVLLKNKNSVLPLADGAKVSLLGKNWNDPTFGGSGSSSFSNSSGSGIDAIGSMKNAGFDLNPTLLDFYADTTASGPKRPVYSYNGANMATGETPLSMYTDKVKASFASYNDAGIVIVTRTGGEGMDVSNYYTAATNGRKSFQNGSGQDATEHYLQLDENEKALVALAKEKFNGKVILVINAAQPIELEDGEFDNIDAIVWAGLPGSTGFAALGRILDGEVNPSGRTADTYAKDFLSMPGSLNYADNRTAAERVDPSNSSSAIKTPAGNALVTITGVDKDGNNTYNYSAGTIATYEEGIYVGYRYYETRGFVEDATDTWYNKEVLYPFGYGLSYTNFTYSNIVFPSDAAMTKTGSVKVSVDVTNSGSVAGKEVVQLYYTAPYTAKKIEKSHVVLGDFVKTKLLNAGETQTVTMEVKVEDMASYDWNDANGNGYKTYELDSGNYNFIVSKNAHSWRTAAAAEQKIMTVATGGFQYEKDIDGKKDKNDNLFDDVSAGIEGQGIDTMTRTDFKGTFPTNPTLEERTISAETASAIASYGVYTTADPTGAKYDTADKPWYTDKMPTQRETELTGTEKNIVKLSDLTGKDYDDALWETFMNQFTKTQLADIVRYGKFRTLSNEILGVPIGKHPDGPFGFVGQVNGYGTARCYYVSPTILAQTFNKELAKEQGEHIGEEGVWLGYNAIYGPGVNIHRNPFCGRNFEYYSECGILSGVMSQYISLGMTQYGVVPFFKHFALNDQETNRGGITTWATEQTMREIYFKPYQYAVEKGNASGAMTAFNRIGLTWAGASYALNNSLLRDEWGMNGMVVTDWGNGGYMNMDQAIRAGNDLSLAMTQDVTRTAAAFASPTHVLALRTSVKNIMYATLHSNAMSKLMDYAALIDKPYQEVYNEYVDGQPNYTGAPTVVETFVVGDGELKIDFSSKTFEAKYTGLTYDIVLGDVLDRRATGQKANNPDIDDAEWISNGWMSFNQATGLVTIKEGAPSGKYQITVALKIPATTAGAGYDATTGDVYIGQQATVIIDYYASLKEYALATEINALQAALTAAQTALATAQADLKAAQTALTAAQGDATKALADVAAAQAAVDAAQAEVDTLNADYTALKSSHDSLKDDYDKLKEDFDALKDKFEKSQEEGCGSTINGTTFAVFGMIIVAAAITIIVIGRKKSKKN